MSLMHPAEKAARRRLEAFPGLRWILERVARHAYEKLVRAEANAAAVKTGPDAFPRFHELASGVGAALDAAVPDLYIRPGAGAGEPRLCGVEKPLALLDAGRLSALTEDQAKALVGRVCAPGLSDGWGLWTALDFLSAAWKALGPAAFPLAGLRWALADWRRAAELSLDRAGALAAGGAAPLRELLLAGIGGAGGAAEKGGAVSETAWPAQLSDFDELTAGWTAGRWRRVGLMLEGGPPWLAFRLDALAEWEAAGGLERAMSGDYSDPETTPDDDPAAAADAAGRTAACEDPFAAGPALWGAFAGGAGAADAEPASMAEAAEGEALCCYCQKGRQRMSDGIKAAENMAGKGFDAAGKAVSAFFAAMRE